MLCVEFLFRVCNKMNSMVYSLSLPRKRESIKTISNWIPAFAGMTVGEEFSFC